MKKLNPNAPSATPTIARPPRKTKQDKLWDDFWEQMPASIPQKDDAAWEEAVETTERQDPKEMLDGQRFQGQGE